MRVLPTMWEREWPRLLADAGLDGTETDPGALERLLHAMGRCGDPVVALCARSLSIRLATHTLVGDRLRETVGRRAAAAGPRTEVALLDRTGAILWVNDAWRDFAAANGGRRNQDWVGVSYLRVCAATDDPAAAAVATAIRTAVGGDLPAPCTVQIPCHSLREERWFDVLVSSRYADDGACVGATVTLSLSDRRPVG